MRQVEDQLIELTLIYQELVQALTLLVGNLEQVREIGKQDAFHPFANHLYDRLQGVLRTSLGADLPSQSIGFESDISG